MAVGRQVIAQQGMPLILYLMGTMGIFSCAPATTP